MLRKFLKVGVAATAATALAFSGMQSAFALPHFPGAGYGVQHVSGMTAKFTVPRLTCHPGENSVVVLGLISPATGTLDGWNAAAVLGCYENQQWSRIQTWVNALGGGHKVADASPGDQITTRIIDAGGRHPTVQAVNETRHSSISYRLMKPATTVAAGSYAGLAVPTFSHVNFNVQVNHRALNKVDRTRRTEWRGSLKVMEPGGIWSSDGKDFSVYFKHR